MEVKSTGPAEARRAGLVGLDAPGGDHACGHGKHGRIWGTGRQPHGWLPTSFIPPVRPRERRDRTRYRTKKLASLSPAMEIPAEVKASYSFSTL